MKSCDALIVGGGPAGSTCARQLSRSGLDIMVMDKADFPRDKVCAGWITPSVVKTLELDLDTYRREHVLQPITGFKVGIIGNAQSEVRYQAPVSYGIRRLEFDDYLLRQSGARLQLGESVKSIQRQNGTWLINGTISTPLLIGAGGNACPVARHIGNKISGGHLQVFAKEIEFLMAPQQVEKCAIRADTPELFFCRDLKGYGWCLRKGDYLNLGFGREDTSPLSPHLNDFCSFLLSQDKLPTDLPQGFHGHAYALYGHSQRQLLTDGALIIGDAAGLATERSGEGIRPAVESALFAAQAITAAAGDYRQQRLRAYEDQLFAHFGMPQPPASGLVADAIRRSLGRILLNSLWFNRHIVLDGWFLRMDKGSERMN
ncbi:MAG: NAD(P)/FAD-dependent oxidoreductase [Azonexus sp.]|nr:NAD(P)/FAD-dependent oxidoreductase [Azonexus sp.]MDZ4315917.1 NAD(P)/FAD-dependent oxidoreductase [Azonexus sp.]